MYPKLDGFGKVIDSTQKLFSHRLSLGGRLAKFRDCSTAVSMKIPASEEAGYSTLLRAQDAVARVFRPGAFP